MKHLERKKIVYELLLRAYDLERYRPAESRLVSSLFLSGSVCERLEKEIFVATSRLEARLGSEEDEDLECVQQAYEEMMEIVGLEMYECGRRFSHWRSGRRRVLVGAVQNARRRMARQKVSKKTVDKTGDSCDNDTQVYKVTDCFVKPFGVQ